MENTTDTAAIDMLDLAFNGACMLSLPLDTWNAFSLESRTEAFKRFLSEYEKYENIVVTVNFGNRKDNSDTDLLRFHTIRKTLRLNREDFPDELTYALADIAHVKTDVPHVQLDTLIITLKCW